MAAQEIKLPLLCKAVHLAPVPGQPGARYGVCWGGMLEPPDSLGYLIEFTGKRTGRVIGWLREGGYVFACDHLIEQAPAERPALTLALWTNKHDQGRITVRDAAGGERSVSEFAVNGNTYTFVDPCCDLGDTYSTVPCEFKQFLAVAYLAFVYIPRVQGASASVGRTMGEVLDEMLKLPPTDAIDALIAEVDRGARTSGFERYAARILRDLDPHAFRTLAARHHVSWLRLSATGLFWISCDASEMTDDEMALVMGFEGALNRLALIERVARRGGSDALSAASEARCADEDWRQLRSIVQQAAPLLGASSEDNPMIRVCGTTGARGGEWDVRTRFARTLESLLLPYRLVYRFAVHAASGEVIVACQAPAAEAMPRWQRAPHGSTSELADCVRNGSVAASAYALRLAALLAAAGFGASAGIARVVVRVCADRALARPVLIADIDRTAYVTEIHERVCADTFAEPALTWSVSGLVPLFAPAHLTYQLDQHTLAMLPLDESGEVPFDPEPTRACALWQDDRALPADLAELLRADTVRELDVFHVGEDPFADRVKAASARSQEDPSGAAQQLADLISMMELMDAVNDGGSAEGAGASGAADGAHAASRIEAVPASDADFALPQPLYCANHMARLAMALVEPDARVRYRYVLDSVYDAYTLLARLCIDNDDAAHGLAYAEQAIELGPTSPQGYIVAATAHMELGQPDQAVELLKRALRYDAQPPSYTYLYYRIAFALWHAGKQRAGLACYERALPNPRLREMTEEEMRALMAESGIRERLTPSEVEAELAQAGVPDAPVDALVELAARALVRATDAGLLNVASLYARTVSSVMRDDSFSAAVASLASWAPEA